MDIKFKYASKDRDLFSFYTLIQNAMSADTGITEQK